MAKTTEGTTTGKSSGIGPVSQKTWLIIAGSLMLFIIAGSLFSYVENTSSTQTADVKQSKFEDLRIPSSSDSENLGRKELTSSRIAETPGENQIFVLEGKEFRLYKKIQLDLPPYLSMANSHTYATTKSEDFSIPLQNGSLIVGLTAVSHLTLGINYKFPKNFQLNDNKDKITDQNGNILFREIIIISKLYDKQGKNMVCQEQKLQECFYEYNYWNLGDYSENKFIENKRQVFNNRPEDAKKAEAYILIR